MNKLSILHNPRCSKSREALGILSNQKVDLEVIDYIKNGVSADLLSDIISKTGMSPFQVIRKNEPEFKNKYKNEKFSDREWIDIMVNHPKLIERPIVFNDHKAVVCRPPEKVNELI